jgi:hypothetical protein
MPVVSKNESQSLWGSGLVLLPLHVPFLMFWEVSMVQPVFVLCAVDLAKAQGGKKLDQPGLARKITNNA